MSEASGVENTGEGLVVEGFEVVRVEETRDNPSRYGPASDEFAGGFEGEVVPIMVHLHQLARGKFDMARGARGDSFVEGLLAL